MFDTLIKLGEGKMSTIVCATLKHCEQHSAMDLNDSSCMVCIQSCMILKQIRVLVKLLIYPKSILV